MLRNKLLSRLPLSSTVLGLTQGLIDGPFPAQLFYAFTFTLEF